MIYFNYIHKNCLFVNNNNTTNCLLLIAVTDSAFVLIINHALKHQACLALYTCLVQMKNNSAEKRRTMKKDAKTMKEVAERCTRYCSCEKGHCGCGATNSTKESPVTCQTCSHYNHTNVCDLDLYEEIMKNHNL